MPKPLSSLFSSTRRWLSIGRLYKDKDLAKLVDLILIAYTKQPVDFVLHYFDVIQVRTTAAWLPQEKEPLSIFY